MKLLTFKRLSSSLLLLSLLVPDSCSQPELAWARQSGSTGIEYVMNHVMDKNGNVYVSGTTSGKMGSTHYGGNDGFIAKYDSLGNLLWTDQFGTMATEDIQWSAADTEGNIYITGTTTGSFSGQNMGLEDIFVAKYSWDGKRLWTVQFGTDSIDAGRGIYAASDGFVYVTGMTLGKIGTSSFGESDAFIMKLDGKGNLLLTHQFGTSGNDQGLAIAGDGMGGILVCGTTWGDIAARNKGFADAFVIRASPDCKVLNSSQFGSEGFDIPMALNADISGNIYVGGSTSGNFGGPQTGEGDCFLVKADNKGTVLWIKQSGTPKNDGIRAIEINENISGNILVSGVLNLPPAQAFIRMYSKAGDVLWEKNLSRDIKNVDSSGKAVTMARDGSIYFSGLTRDSLFGPLAGESDYFLAKFKVQGSRF